MSQRVMSLLLALVVMAGIATAGNLESVGLDVGKPPLLGAARPIAWLAAPAAAWPEVRATLERYGRIIGFSTTTKVTGQQKDTTCRALVALENLPSVLEQANKALRERNLPTLRVLERAVVDVAWERFLSNWHMIEIPGQSVHMKESVMRVGRKQRRLKIGNDAKTLARDLYRLSEACRNPTEFTKANLGQDAGYWVIEAPLGRTWMDLFSVRILSEALGSDCEAVFELRFFWKGSVSKPFALPSEYSDPWK